MNLKIPTKIDASAYISQTTTLEGTDYRLTIKWNERDEYWYLDVYDIDDVALATGIRLVSNISLLRKKDILSDGILCVIGQAYPDYDGLGLTSDLYYLED